ncbi:MAG TPA: thioredoxin-like domain-containing protein [Planctomycetota bacterium]|nr:thioredoxin-like domain-containing protein [Planctomycetota bacterium]
MSSPLSHPASRWRPLPGVHPGGGRRSGPREGPCFAGRALRLAGICLGVLWASAGRASGAEESLDQVIEGLRGQFPDRRSVMTHSGEITQRLLLAAGESASEEDAGRARLLAAEVLSLAGAGAEARRLVGQVAASDGAGDAQARALYLLGEALFLRERYVARRQRGAGEGRGEEAPRGAGAESALGPWSLLAEKYPQSEWAQSVARPLRYLRILEALPVPGGDGSPSGAPVLEPFSSFRETFRRPASAAFEVEARDLRGKVVLLLFWTASTRGEADFEKQLSRDLKTTLVELPELSGRVEILGVNLDRQMKDFEAAVTEWGIEWPQHHDGLGFRTPLAELFAVPRSPHRALLGPDGRLVYLGSDDQKTFQALNTELRRLRQE